MIRLPIRIGTRGSPLALAQANETRSRLMAAAGLGADAATIEVLSTTGDQVQDRPLSEIGGKGLFTKELDAALLDGRIDCAVHSMKDVPTVLPAGIAMAALLPREDVRDAFVSLSAAGLDALPTGARVGTASLRRQAQVLNRRPDLSVSIFRGNVQTRLRKLSEGQADATFLALAGLRRLDMASTATEVQPIDAMLPAPAQGAVGVACRAGDEALIEAFGALHDLATGAAIVAERAFLRRLDGSCRTPIAGFASLEDSGRALWFRGEILSPDGRRRIAVERRGPTEDGELMGHDAGEEARAAAGPGFWDALESR